MAIPSTREELLEQITSSYERLAQELDGAGASVAGLPCADDWTVKDLLAVRAWWAASLADWIAAGLRGEHPATPDRGYKWSETPCLNAHIVKEAGGESYSSVRGRLQRNYERLLALLADLDDEQLLDTQVFAWAGKWPVSRWASINTTRQFTTARTMIRAALRRDSP